MTIRYININHHVGKESFSGKILAEIRREFGAKVEPFTLHLPVPELLAGMWMACRETLLAGDGRRDAKEIVALAVSTLNQCPYCVDAHSIMLLGSSGTDYVHALFDSYLSAVAAWASAKPNSSSPHQLSPPFSCQEAPAFIGTAVFFHYINRMVTILLGASPLPFTHSLPKKVSMQIAAWFFGGAIHLQKNPGTSLNLLPDCPLPHDLLWAKPSKPISSAFARFAGAVEKAGTIALSPHIREMVSNVIQQWNGEEPSIDNRWCEDAIAPFEKADKTAGRLALLTALAPYRVDETIIRGFSAHFSGDKNLISALAWSSFNAAIKRGALLNNPDF